MTTTPDTTTEPTEPQYLTIEQVSRLLQIPVPTLRRWRRLHIGPASFLLVGALRYDRRVLYEWVAAQQTTAA